MIVRLQASVEVKQNPDSSCELSSSFLQKKFGISTKHSQISALLRDLQKGITLPHQLVSLSKKYGFKEIILKLKVHDLLVEEKM